MYVCMYIYITYNVACLRILHRESIFIKTQVLPNPELRDLKPF